MKYKRRYYNMSERGGGKNCAKSRARRRAAIDKGGTRLWRREFDEPCERQAVTGEGTYLGRIV